MNHFPNFFPPKCAVFPIRSATTTQAVWKHTRHIIAQRCVAHTRFADVGSWKPSLESNQGMQKNEEHIVIAEFWRTQDPSLK